MGTYRAGLKATDRLGVRMASRLGGAGGYLHWQKYRARKEPMPIAIVVGCAPVVMFTGPMKLALDLDEMAVAGGLAGAPIRIAKAITVDPESGIRNMSTNRAALKATDRLGVRMSSRIGGAGGYLHWLKYQKMGKPLSLIHISEPTRPY